MKYIRFTILLVMLFLAQYCFGNNVLLPKIVNFKKTDYQAHNKNWAVTQGADGIMYIANNMGVMEFDGSAWAIHSLPDKQTPRSLAADEKGRIFAGGYGEFGYWERDLLGQLRYHSISEGALKGNAQHEEFWHILIVKETVYFQSFSSLYKWTNDQVEELSPPGNIMFLRYVNEQLLAPVLNKGLFKLRSDGSFQALPGGDFFSDKTVSCILSKGEQILVGTEKQGLFVFDGDKVVPWESEIHKFVKKSQLNKGIELSNGSLAFGTILDGAFIVNQQGEIIFHLNQENGLQNNTILSTYQDHEGNLWLGLDRGVSLIPLGQPLLFYEDRKGLIGSVYTAILHKSRLYVGTNRGLFVRNWPLQSQEPFKLIQGSQGQTWDLIEQDGQLLCGHNNGTFKIEDDDRLEPLSNTTGGWRFCVLPEENNKIVQGTYTGLILLKKEPSSRLWNFCERIKGFGWPVKNIIQGNQRGTFWVFVPNEGIFRLQLNSALDSVLQYTHYKEDKGLPARHQIDLQRINDQIVVQTEGSFFQYRSSSDQFITVDPAQLSGSMRQGKLIWLSEEAILTIREQFVKIYCKDKERMSLPLQLIPGNEFVTLLTDSLLFFGLDEGFAILNQEHVYDVPKPIEPRLKTIVFLDRKGTPSQVRQVEEAVLETEAGANNVSFEFYTPVFTHPVMMRYRLPPFQQEWSDWGLENSKTFTNLPPGSYRLELQSNRSPAVVSQSFKIPARWYQTPWVLIPYGLLIALIIYSFNRWHKKRLRIQQRKILIQKEKQIQQERIQLRNEQLKKDILSKSQELANSTFNLIRKNEILIQVKEELKKVKRKPNSQNELYSKVIRLIDRHLDSQDDWEVFEENFNEVHEVFLKKLINAYPDLTPGDLKLAAYLRMNLSSKEIAPLLNISIRGVENKRYRLRKKLNLPPEENLTEFMIHF